jgi:hypothetical protein
MVAEWNNCPYFHLQMVILTGKWAVAALDFSSGTYFKQMGIGHWELGIGHWALGIGNWALVLSEQRL